MLDSCVRANCKRTANLASNHLNWNGTEVLDFILKDHTKMNPSGPSKPFGPEAIRTLLDRLFEGISLQITNMHSEESLEMQTWADRNLSICSREDSVQTSVGSSKKFCTSLQVVTAQAL